MVFYIQDDMQKEAFLSKSKEKIRKFGTNIVKNGTILQDTSGYAILVARNPLTSSPALNLAGTRRTL